MPPRFPSALSAPQVSIARYLCPELPRSPQPLEVVCAGWENCRSDYDLIRRSFPWFGALVKQVAELAGFDDPFHFSQVFRRMQGISPAVIQRMHQRTAAG